MQQTHVLTFLKSLFWSLALLAFIAACTDKKEDPAPAPVANFSFSPQSPSVGDEVQFTNSSTNATSYQWSADGTNFTSTEENPKFTFTTAGSFEVKLVATGSGGSNTRTQTITVATPAAPTAAFTFSPSNPEVGQEVQFTNQSQNATSFQWSATGTNFNSTEENPKFTFTSAGNFVVKLVVTGAGGTNEKTQTISVATPPPAPVAAFTFSPQNPTVNQEVQFTNQSQNATSYLWSVAGTNLTSTEENPKFTFTSEGSFSVTLVATGAGGTNETTKTVTVAASAPAPTVAFTFSPTSPIEGEQVQFTNQSQNATSYQWTVEGTNLSSTEENPKFTFTSAGDFNVKLVATGAGGTAQLTKKVTVTQGSSTSNPCNLPACYITKTVTSASGVTITVTYEYTTVAGKKLISKISTASIGGTTVTSIQYDAQGKRIKDETRVAGTLSNSIDYEYSNGDRIVKASTFNASGAFQGHTISTYDANNRLTKQESFDANGALQSYVEYSNFLSIEGSFPQLVQTFTASGTLTQKDVHTYQNCMLVKTVSTDGSGTQIGEVTNTLNTQGFINVSTAKIITVAGTFTSTTNYTYQCD